MVLGLLNAADQLQGLGPVLDLQGQHLQAGLAARQGVAALVGQAGHHLADRRQALGLQGALLSLAQRGDVLADRQDCRLAGVVEEEAALRAMFNGAL